MPKCDCLGIYKVTRATARKGKWKEYPTPFTIIPGNWNAVGTVDLTML